MHNFPKSPGVRDHPFRFVFLDGCRRAKGDWCKAFGIPRTEDMSTNDFVSKGLRFRAFVGWNKYIIAGWVGGPDTAHPNFLGKLLDTWPKIDPNTGVPYTLVAAKEAAKGGYAVTVNAKLRIPTARTLVGHSKVG